MEKLKVKVGNKVLLHAIGSFASGEVDEICEVSRITPTGRICLKEYPDVRFDKYGHLIGDPNYLGTDHYIKPILETEEQEIRTRIERKTVEMEALELCHYASHLPYETAVKIIELLGEAAAANEAPLKSYRDFEKVCVGSSDIAVLTAVGIDQAGSVKCVPVHMGEDGMYFAYHVTGEAEIGSHYMKVADFKDWLKIYDDSGMAREFKGEKIIIYRAGNMGMIVQTIK